MLYAGHFWLLHRSVSSGDLILTVHACEPCHNLQIKGTGGAVIQELEQMHNLKADCISRDCKGRGKGH